MVDPRLLFDSDSVKVELPKSRAEFKDRPELIEKVGITVKGPARGRYNNMAWG